MQLYNIFICYVSSLRYWTKTNSAMVYQVAQYVNLELPILQRVLLKLQDEENQEIQRIISKWVLHLEILHNIVWHIY